MADSYRYQLTDIFGLNDYKPPARTPIEIIVENTLTRAERERLVEETSNNK